MAGDDDDPSADPQAAAAAALAAAAAEAARQAALGDAAAAAVTAAIEAASGGVNAVRANNYPEFWTEDPEAWFEMLEQMFKMDRVTSQSSMFMQAIRRMPWAVYRNIKDITRNIPALNPYDYLKAETIKRLAPNNEQKLRQLLSVEEIGDSTPSQFLRRLRDLAGTTITDPALQTLWLDRLPPSYGPMLVSIPAQTLDQLSTIADNIHTVLKAQRPAVNAASAASSSGQDELLAAIRELTKRVGAIESKLSGQQSDGRQSRPRFRNDRSQTPAQRSQSRPLEKNGNCFYHTKFGKKARRCTDGCKWSENN